jgi:ectoine hydroxylase-related dioxygenase (phytanoyl-CoA dioxygenase family)
MSDLELQQYLFDLNGYLVVEDVLDPQALATLNEHIDRQNVPESKRFQRIGAAAGSEPGGPGFLAWGQPCVDLLDHEAIMPILRFRLGDCFRLDRLYAIFMQKGTPRGQLHADYGVSTPTSKAVPGEYYPVPDHQIASGFVVVCWNLAPAGPDYGGFCCIPGSHKSNFKLPKKILDAPEEAPCVIIPEAPAGSVTLFSEALTHGTTAWQAEHDRRTLLYKYCVSQMAWSSVRVQPPADVELTPRQKILFNEPADPHRFFPSLFED